MIAISHLLLSCAAEFAHTHPCIEVKLLQSVTREIVAEFEAFVQKPAHERLLIIDYRPVQKGVP